MLGFKRGSDQIMGLTLGLDLAGGINLVYQAGNVNGQPPTQNQMDGLISTITRRIDSLGVASPTIQQLGKDRLVIQLPGFQNISQAEGQIGKTAQLKIVHRVCNNPGCTSYTDQDTGLTGADMSSASPGQDPTTGKPILLFQLKPAAAKHFAEVTQQIYATNTTKPNNPDQLAFTLDNQVLVSADVQSPILSGSGQITGNFTAEQVRQLAIQIESGALPVPVQQISSSTIAPTLGSLSLKSALVAGIVGLALVMFFMTVYYRLSGFVASLVLAFYTAIVLAIFKLIPVTLTLAGVAGFIMTLGMAVDVNVLIFERMKEELRAGRTLPFSLQIGFNRAWSAIRDGHVSTLITAAILFFFGSSGANSAVTGFAVTLAIGVVANLFTAFAVTRTVLAIVIATPLRKFPVFSPEGSPKRASQALATERGA